MPYDFNSTYKPPLALQNGHAATLYSGVVKKLDPPDYRRWKLDLADGDFLSVDYQEQNPEKAVILCHGLEGSSKSGYNNSAAHYFLRKKISVFSWNNRSCGGAMNLRPQLYHHASVRDLNAVVQAVLDRGFKEVYLLGFSLGGAQILNYFGRMSIDARIKAGVAVSTPIDLRTSAQKIEKGFSRIYLNRFIKKIKGKIIQKAQLFPDEFDMKAVKAINSFDDLAKVFMVPAHGFADIEGYYQKASPASSLSGIKTPVLILNALNDPMLGEADYPRKIAKENSFIFLETPEHGGHCAFPMSKSNFSFAEIRAERFFEKFSTD